MKLIYKIRRKKNTFVPFVFRILINMCIKFPGINSFLHLIANWNEKRKRYTPNYFPGWKNTAYEMAAVSVVLCSLFSECIRIMITHKISLKNHRDIYIDIFMQTYIYKGICIPLLYHYPNVKQTRPI